MSTSPLALIRGVGAMGPLGLDALQVTLCARAAKLEPRPTAFLDRRKYPIGTARALTLPDALQGFERLVALAAPAAREAASTSRTSRPRAPAAQDFAAPPPPLIVAAPPPGRADDDARLAQGLPEAIATRAEIRLDLARSEVIRTGQAGFAAALERAVTLLRERAATSVLVGGVDSHHHPDVLAALDGDYRLHAPDVSDGLLPSEGAAFLLLEPETGASSDASLARLRAARTSREETLATGASTDAEATTRLLRSTLLAAGAPAVPWLLTDVNGERHRVREWTMVQIRSHDLLASTRIEHWVEQLGDAGAATGALLAVLACMAWKTGFAPADTALLALHGDTPERGVVLLEAAR